MLLGMLAVAVGSIAAVVPPRFIGQIIDGLNRGTTLDAIVRLALFALFFSFIGRRVHVKFARLQAQFSEMSTAAQENFSGIRVVKAFSQEEAEIGRFAAVNEEYVKRAINLRRMDGLIWPTMSFILGLAVLATLYIGGQDAIEGRMTLGQLVQFVAYLNLLAWPMIALGWVSNLFQQGWASLQRLQDIWDARPD